MSTSSSPRRKTRRRRVLKAILVTVGALVLLAIAGGLILLYLIGREDPSRYEAQVAAIEEEFEGTYTQGGVLLSGSSYFEHWETSDADLAPLDTVNIGIGGTRVGDHLAYFDRMVLPFKPRTLVLYIGSNDISGLPLYSKSPEVTVDLIKAYIKRARLALPDTRIYYVAITEAPIREGVRADIVEANRLLAELALETGDFIFIDTAPALLHADGSIDVSLFGDDRLHFNEKGYRVFAAAVREGLADEYQPLR